MASSGHSDKQAFITDNYNKHCLRSLTGSDFPKFPRSGNLENLLVGGSFPLPPPLCAQKPRNSLLGFLFFSLIFCTNIPTFLRRLILYGFVYGIDDSDLREYNYTLVKIGVNLNQIA